MAITRIGNVVSGNANNGANVTLTWSTTPSAGDYTVVVIGTVAAAATNVSMSTSGYTRVAYYTGADNTQPAIAVFYKKQGASPDTTAVCVNGNGSTTEGMFDPEKGYIRPVGRITGGIVFSCVV